MLNISSLRLQLAEDGVQATSIARAELTTRVAEFKELGDEARVIVFGSHRKAQAAIVPIELFEELMDLAEGVPHLPRAEQPKKRSRKRVVQKADTTEAPTPAKIEAEINKLEQGKQLAGSDLHIGASTQELLDEIMKKWNL
jgi:hypothetical protein